jgi:hypothetical protein
MTWTYGGDPSANDRDAVRYLIGDTNTAKQQLSDEEIAFSLAEEGGKYRAAAAACRAIAAKYGRMVDKAVGDLRLSYSQLQKQYLDLAEKLDTKSSAGTAIPYQGGQTVSDKNVDDLDTDRVQPAFKRNQFDFPGQGSQTDLIDEDE